MEKIIGEVANYTMNMMPDTENKMARNQPLIHFFSCSEQRFSGIVS